MNKFLFRAFCILLSLFFMASTGCSQTGKKEQPSEKKDKIVYTRHVFTGTIENSSREEIKNAVEILKKRLNLLKLQDVGIRQENDRLILDLPENTDITRIRNIVEKRGDLEIREMKKEPGADWTAAIINPRFDEVKSENDPGGNLNISFILSESHHREFKDLTSRNLGKNIAIFMDGQLIDAPRVMDEIHNGQGMIQCFYLNDPDAEELAAVMQSGRLPFELKVEKIEPPVDERTEQQETPEPVEDGTLM